ncbi:MAG: RNA methyltransferase [Streptococcaceae bacterium]|jgi:TrmH family RNA methyltransferase|nr:RNA methyltransferase [Streptococcaceae bacterium]
MDLIKSTTNARIKEARKLQQKKYRDASETYLIEGFHLLEEALKSGVEIRQIWVEQAHLVRLSNLTAAQTATKTLSNLTTPVTSEVLKALSETQSPQGVVSEVVKSDRTDFEPGRVLILENIQDPGNVGTMIRTADAAGFDAVYTVESADIYSSKALRSMQGSHFHLPVIPTINLSELVTQLQNAHLKILTTTLSADSVPYQSIQEERFALIMGNEGAGVSQVALKAADLKVHIPMPGHAESLNVAVAAGILMFAL